MTTAYIPPSVHATLLATIRRDRLLPVMGDVTVQPRQRVEATDMVARALVAEKHLLINYARELGVKPEKADSYLLKAEGEMLKKGENIAVRKGALGLGKRVLRSPVDGRILMLTGRGEALTAAYKTPLELQAGMPGEIVNIIEHWGVTIETSGALCEGVWGNGREGYGELVIVGSELNTALTAEAIKMDMRGKIVAIGTLTEEAPLKKVAEVRVRGVIFGSVPLRLMPAIQKLNLPVMVADGFHDTGFGEPGFVLLEGNQGRGAWLHAQRFDFIEGQRPEVIIPLPGPSTPPLPPANGEAVMAGKRVQVVRGAETGQIGTVVAVSDRPQTAPSGLRARLASIDLATSPGALIKVPVMNVENLE
jgi:hypothetical protein